MKLNDKYDNIELNDIKLNDIKLNNIELKDIKLNDMKLNNIKLNDIKLNDKYYYKYLKYKKKYLQYGSSSSNITLWGYIQNIISNISSEDKIIANTILPSLGLSFDNLSYKNYPNDKPEEGTIISRRTEFIKLLQKWKENNLNIHTTLILDMYKNDLDIIKNKVLQLGSANNNILPTKKQEIELFPYLKHFYNDILQYCDNKIIEIVLITWFKTIYSYLDIDKRTFCILLILLSYLNNCDNTTNSLNKKRLSKIISNILIFLQDFINIKNYL